MTIDGLSINEAQLKRKTRDILAQHDSFYRYDEGTGLTWESFEEDSLVFTQVCDYLWQTAELADAEFVPNIVSIRELVLSSQVFSRLTSQAIRVTAGHEGARPFDHTINVLSKLKTTDDSTKNERFILRLSALFHDAGKGLVADLISDPEIATLFKNGEHTHPDHAVISALILSKFGQEYKKNNYSDDENLAQLVDQASLIILHHHLFQDLIDNKASLEEVVAVFRSRPDLIFLIFLVCRADVDSIQKYRSEWSHRYVLLQQLSELLEITINEETAIIAQAVLGLPATL
jgi:hypothetical protein